VPTVSHLDEWWHRKYQEDENHRLRRVENVQYFSTPEGPSEPPHLPSPSYWPLILALGLPFIAWGLLYSYWLCGVGGLLVFLAAYGWSLEPSVDPTSGHHDDDHHEVEAHHDDGPVAVTAGAGDEAETTETSE
jgi:cytochrome c oxidase subunit 1